MEITSYNTKRVNIINKINIFYSWFVISFVFISVGYYFNLFIQSVVLIFGLTVISVVHEGGHALAARWFDIKIKSINIGILSANVQYFSIYSEQKWMIICATGPIASLSLTIFFYYMYIITGIVTLKYLSVFALFDATFNFIPIQKSDGEQILTILRK